MIRNLEHAYEACEHMSGLAHSIEHHMMEKDVIVNPGASYIDLYCTECDVTWRIVRCHDGAKGVHFKCESERNADRGDGENKMQGCKVWFIPNAEDYPFTGSMCRPCGEGINKLTDEILSRPEP